MLALDLLAARRAWRSLLSSRVQLWRLSPHTLIRPPRRPSTTRVQITMVSNNFIPLNDLLTDFDSF